MTAHQLFVSVFSFLAGVFAFMAYLTWIWIWIVMALVCIVVVILDCNDENKVPQNFDAKY